MCVSAVSSLYVLLRACGKRVAEIAEIAETTYNERMHITVITWDDCSMFEQPCFINFLDAKRREYDRITNACTTYN